MFDFDELDAAEDSLELSQTDEGKLQASAEVVADGALPAPRPLPSKAADVPTAEAAPPVLVGQNADVVLPKEAVPVVGAPPSKGDCGVAASPSPEVAAAPPTTVAAPGVRPSTAPVQGATGECSPDATKETAPKYWRVVRTVDPSGIAVRPDGFGGGAGRLPLHSVVLEKEQVGNELRYVAPPNHSSGPRSGWVKIESVGKILLECIGSDPGAGLPKQVEKKGEKLNALIVFDWDDTLCPTSWIEERPELRSVFQGGICGTGEVWERLVEHAQAINRLLETAQSLGSVAVVTLAERPWVANSVRDFLPQASTALALEAYYARECAVMRAPAGVCPFTAMKRRAMQLAMEGMITMLGKGTSWESFVSVGDSDVEKRAAQDLGREFQIRGTVRWTKTVKMAEHPSISQLTAQIRSLERQLPDIVKSPGHRHMSTADWAKRR